MQKVLGRGGLRGYPIRLVWRILGLLVVLRRLCYETGLPKARFRVRVRLRWVGRILRSWVGFRREGEMGLKWGEWRGMFFRGGLFLWMRWNITTRNNIARSKGNVTTTIERVMR